MEDDVSAAWVLARALELSGLTQAELARRAGSPRSLIGDYLKGRKEPGLAQLLRLVRASGCDAAVRVSGPSPSRANAAQLELVCAMAMALPRRDRGPLRYPPFRTLTQ